MLIICENETIWKSKKLEEKQAVVQLELSLLNIF